MGVGWRRDGGGSFHKVVTGLSGVTCELRAELNGEDSNENI